MSQTIEFYAYLNGINKSKMVEFPDSASLFDISKEFDKWLDNYFYAQIRKLDGDDDTLDVVTKVCLESCKIWKEKFRHLLMDFRFTINDDRFEEIIRNSDLTNDDLEELGLYSFVQFE